MDELTIIAGIWPDSFATPMSPQFRFIVIADRTQSREEISGVVKWAVDMRQTMGDGFIAGLDLAGDEHLTASHDEIAACFEPAFASCLPVTIHAGEGEQPDAIWQSVYRLHADRIGHGLTIGDHPDLLKRFRDRGICVELCPTSNVEVVGFCDPAQPASLDCPEYPLQYLRQSGLMVTLCTDNPGISRTTLADEYLAAARMSGAGLNRLLSVVILCVSYSCE